MLNVHRFKTTSDGKLAECSFEEQRGNVEFVSDFCLTAQRETFDPPFAAFDKDGTATGWHIIRVLRKIGP